MKKVKICFLGNCQAQTFQTLCKFANENIEVLPLKANYLIQDKDFGVLENVFNEVDIIFHQRVDVRHKIEFVRSDWIKRNYFKKAISWPNIYFDGYFPGIRYLYSGASKVEGPLGDYHFEQVIYGWKNRLSPHDVADAIHSGNQLYQFPLHSHPVESSLLKLRLREQNLDCIISDFIRDRFRAERCFYTMNHPTMPVLWEMMSRLLTVAEISFLKNVNLNDFPYKLDQVIIPCFGYFNKNYRPSFKEGKDIKSFRLNANGNVEPHYISWKEAINAYYRIFDFIPDLNV